MNALLNDSTSASSSSSSLIQQQQIEPQQDTKDDPVPALLLLVCSNVELPRATHTVQEVSRAYNIALNVFLSKWKRQLMRE